MSFRSIVRDVRDSIGSLSRRSFDIRLSIFNKGKSQGFGPEGEDDNLATQNSCWANLPPELLRDVIKRLDEGNRHWPSRKNVVACAAVCRLWRATCKEIVMSPEISGILTFPVSLKQPGPRDGVIQCFIKRDKPNSTYRLFLCLSPALIIETGKFLLSAKRVRRPTCTEFIISTHPDCISRSSSTYIGKLRSNFIGTKFIIYDTQQPYNGSALPPPGRTSRRFTSKKISPKIPTGSYNIAQVAYELNILGTRGPRRMHCVMSSVPASALDAGFTVPGVPENIVEVPFGDSFRSYYSKSSVVDQSMESSSFRFSDILMDSRGEGNENEHKEGPLILRNKAPRWHEQLQCWCLNFRGRVTVASVKNFQLIAATQPTAGSSAEPIAGAPAAAQPFSSEHDKVLLQFGKVAKDTFTMDYRYPLSAFQAFTICLSSFDTKLACE